MEKADNAKGEMKMTQALVHIALVVRDYVEAIDFYTKRLHFDLVEDSYISGIWFNLVRVIQWKTE